LDFGFWIDSSFQLNEAVLAEGVTPVRRLFTENMASAPARVLTRSKSEIRNPKSKIALTRSKSKIQNPKSKIA